MRLQKNDWFTVTFCFYCSLYSYEVYCVEVASVLKQRYDKQGEHYHNSKHQSNDRLNFQRIGAF
ncbi:hypothetical protein [Paenibacillus sp. CFBP13512]|uniref:hypothetical protein n=1 Tax=Paenibacillus sp. CFBP13512 TaxID=2184007 RepID=UPI0010C04C72|nr:hypothetical protein [Paenibacillus sp. CFBP13512]